MENMTTGRPMKLIAGFAVPLLIGSIFQQVYNFVDVIVVGRYLGEQALSVFTGQNIGQKRFDRIRSGLRDTLVMSVIASIAIAAVAFFFGRDLMMLFLGEGDSPEAVRIGAEYLSIMGIAYLICGIMQSYQNVIRGAGDVNTCMVAGMTELAGRIFFAYLLAPRIGVTGIWFATPLSWGCGCIVPVVRYYSGKWKGKALVEQKN